MSAVIKILVESSGGVDAVKRDLTDLGNTAKNAGGGFNSLKEIATGALRQIGAGAVNALGMAAQAAVGFIQDSIGAAGDFEAGMTQFAAAAGDALDKAGMSTEQFRDIFLDLGKRLPVSTAEVQQAAIALVKGGLDPAVVAAGALESALQFAAAAGMGLEEAAELSVKQLGTFVPMTASAAEQTEFLAKAQDLLVKAAGASTLNVDKLGDAMLAAGGQARATGLDYQDFVTTMGLISPAFGSAAEAGTSFKNFLVRLQPSTTAAKDTMAALGLYTEETGSAFFDAQGKFVGVREAADLLKNSMGGLTDAERLMALQTIFGNDAMGSATALISAGAEGYDIFAQKMADANGVQAQAQTTQEGYNFAMTNFKGTIEALQITIGSSLLPILTSLMEKSNELAGVALTMVDAFNGDKEAMDQLSPSGQAIVTTLQSMVDLIQAQVNPVIATLSTFWTTILQPALLAVWTVFETQILPILNNLALTILPILNSALQVAASFWENILQPALERAWEMFTTQVLPILQDVTAWLKDNLPPAIQVVADFLSNTLFPVLKKVNDFIDATLSPILEALGRLLSAVIGKAVEGLAGLWENVLLPALQKAGSWIDSTLGPILSDFSSWLGDVTGGMDGISSAVKKVVDWINKLIDAINNVELPDWMTPGSPTPFEIAMRGLANAFQVKLNPQMQAFASTLNTLPPVNPMLQSDAQSGAVNNTYNNTNLTFAPRYSSGAGVKLDYTFAKSLAGVA